MAPMLRARCSRTASFGQGVRRYNDGQDQAGDSHANGRARSHRTLGQRRRSRLRRPQPARYGERRRRGASEPRRRMRRSISASTSSTPRAFTARKRAVASAIRGRRDSVVLSTKALPAGASGLMSAAELRESLELSLVAAGHRLRRHLSSARRARRSIRALRRRAAAGTGACARSGQDPLHRHHGTLRHRHGSRDAEARAARRSLRRDHGRPQPAESVRAPHACFR